MHSKNLHRRIAKCTDTKKIGLILKHPIFYKACFQFFKKLVFKKTKSMQVAASQMLTQIGFSAQTVKPVFKTTWEIGTTFRIKDSYFSP